MNMKKHNWSEKGEKFRQELLQDLNNNRGRENEVLKYMEMKAKTDEEKKIIGLYRLAMTVNL